MPSVSPSIWARIRTVVGAAALMALLGPCVNNVPSVDADVRVDLALIPTQTNSMSADDEAGAVDGGDAADQTPQSSYRVVGVVSHEAGVVTPRAKSPAATPSSKTLTWLVPPASMAPS